MSHLNKQRVLLLKGRVRWYYKLVGGNGEDMLVSQKYYSKSNAKRAALVLAKNVSCGLVELKR